MQMKKNEEKSIKEIKEEAEHYKIYFKAWQRSRKMIHDVLNNGKLSKDEKAAINTIFNTMTLAIDEEVRSQK